MQNHHAIAAKSSFLNSKRDKFDKKCKSMCKKPNQIQWESVEIHSDAPTKCFTFELCRFDLDLGGFLARGFALISLLSTKHLQKSLMLK